jgi:GH24 family phage-related lysozyme (muramidase)|tara:strand:+ start:758 stop:1273 length:516 start_codon:yes stop_codon:yes gene_type:complete
MAGGAYDFLTDDFFEALARAENEPLFLSPDDTPLKIIEATGKKTSRPWEGGYGITGKSKEELLNQMQTKADADKVLKQTIKDTADQISSSGIFKDKFYEYPDKLKQILVSIAFNVGTSGLNAYTKLKEAMDAGDTAGIFREMLTFAEGVPLTNRRNLIYGDPLQMAIENGR